MKKQFILIIAAVGCLLTSDEVSFSLFVNSAGKIKQIKRNAKKYINIFFIFSPSYSLIYELSFNFMLFKILRSILDTCT